MDGFAEKSADNLISEINNSKEILLEKYIYSLGIRYVGQETCRILSEYIYKQKNIKTPLDFYNFFYQLNKSSIQEIDGIGEISSKSIKEYFENSENREFSEKITKLGIKFTQKPIISGNLIGKKFIMTGKFDDITRDEVYEKIKQQGGTISSSINKKVDYLIVGENPGSKLKKAQSLNIKILSEKDIKKMLN